MYINYKTISFFEIRPLWNTRFRFAGKTFYKYDYSSTVELPLTFSTQKIGEVRVISVGKF